MGIRDKLRPSQAQGKQKPTTKTSAAKPQRGVLFIARPPPTPQPFLFLSGADGIADHNTSGCLAHRDSLIDNGLAAQKQKGNRVL
jgi:hypothetical protein